MNDEVVAEQPEVAQTETTEDVSAQTDEKTLDDLLAEFDSEVQETPEPTKETESKPDENQQWIESFRREQEARETDEAVSGAAKTVIESLGDDVPVNVTEEFVTDLLYGKASRDQRFLNAFVQRRQNPEAWNSVLKGIGKKLKDDLGKPIDQQVTKDREAVVTAVRGNSTATDEAPNFANMTDAEFQQWKLNAR